MAKLANALALKAGSWQRDCEFDPHSGYYLLSHKAG